MKKIQIIIPVFNEEASISSNLKKIQEITNILKEKYQISFLIVNDGSKDLTEEILTSINKEDQSIKLLSFTRNFGKEAAIIAGLESSQADAVIVMDSDLQHPPIIIPQMIEKWETGYKVVEAIKESRGKESISSKILPQASTKHLTRLQKSTSGGNLISSCSTKV